MKAENQKVIDVLNELVRINNDRISGYHMASQETKDSDLEQLFTSMLNESINFAETLEAYIQEMGGKPVGSGTAKGKIHQAWLNFKAALLGNDREGLLSSCEFGDKAVAEAYQAALKIKEVKQKEEINGVLLRQQANIESSLKIIQALNPRSKSTQAEREALKLI
jgi:uncharacterized protein (TIGR02284 family)